MLIDDRTKEAVDSAGISEDGRAGESQVPDEVKKTRNSSEGGRGSMGLVYFVEIVGKGFIKIGFTTNLDQRMRSLTSALGRPKLLAFMPGVKAVEFWVHHRLEPDCLDFSRECYSPSKDVMAFIRAVGFPRYGSFVWLPYIGKGRGRVAPSECLTKWIGRKSPIIWCTDKARDAYFSIPSNISNAKILEKLARQVG